MEQLLDGETSSRNRCLVYKIFNAQEPKVTSNIAVSKCGVEDTKGSKDDKFSVKSIYH